MCFSYYSLIRVLYIIVGTISLYLIEFDIQSCVYQSGGLGFV